MFVSNRIASVVSIPTLALAGLIAASSSTVTLNLAAAEGAAPLNNSLQPTVWTPSPGASAVANEMRESLQADIRQQMVDALRPDSLVWNGALNGQKLAQEMREEVTSQLRGEMVAGLQSALGETRANLQPDPKEEKATSAPSEQWLASRSPTRGLPSPPNVP